MTDITSTSNAKYKYIKSLLKKKFRYENGEYTVEGIKSVRDALDAGAVRAVAVSEEFCKSTRLDFCGAEVYRVSDDIFPSLCDTQTPQGIIGIVPMHESTAPFDTSKVYIYCDCLQDPGNAGTIIRTADAAGMGGVIFSKGSVDIYSPKTVRASMGSFFHTDIRSGADTAVLEGMKNAGFNIICTALCADTVSYTSVDMTQPSVIVIGNEANGVSGEVLDMSSARVKIPIYGRAESLNAGVAAAVMMYEAARQRERG